MPGLKRGVSPSKAAAMMSPGGTVCWRCKRAITGRQESITVFGKQYHASGCFGCFGCGMDFDDGDAYVGFESLPFHPGCVPG